MRNLVENAVAYGRQAQTSAITNAGDGYDVMIEDEGPGIPEGDQQRVFEPFVRLESPRATQKPAARGWGLRSSKPLPKVMAAPSLSKTAPRAACARAYVCRRGAAARLIFGHAIWIFSHRRCRRRGARPFAPRGRTPVPQRPRALCRRHRTLAESGASESRCRPARTRRHRRKRSRRAHRRTLRRRKRPRQRGLHRTRKSLRHRIRPSA